MKTGKYYSCMKDFFKENASNTEKMFILVAEYTEFDFENLKNYSGEIFGGIVPFVVYNNKFYNKGIIACPLEKNSDFMFVEDLNYLEEDSIFFENKKSFFVLLDGLSSNITNFLENLFEVVSFDARIMGAGAGKLTFNNDPVIFTKEKICANAAVLIATSMTLHTKIGSGWKYLDGPFLATSSEKNVLKTLNFQKSFDVYKKIVEKNSGKYFFDDNFFDIAKSYPLGIVKFDNQIIVRDPIYSNENYSITLVGDIPQNATVNILKGEIPDLIKSSGIAVKKLLEESNCTDNQDIILFDCISRSIFLGDSFIEELNEMKSNMKVNSTLFGALTLGEIANNSDEYISFYNKTCVVGILC